MYGRTTEFRCEGVVDIELNGATTEWPSDEWNGSHAQTFDLLFSNFPISTFFGRTRHEAIGRAFVCQWKSPNVSMSSWILVRLYWTYSVRVFKWNYRNYNNFAKIVEREKSRFSVESDARKLINWNWNRFKLCVAECKRDRLIDPSWSEPLSFSAA